MCSRKKREFYSKHHLYNAIRRALEKESPPPVQSIPNTIPNSAILANEDVVQLLQSEIERSQEFGGTSDFQWPEFLRGPSYSRADGLHHEAARLYLVTGVTKVPSSENVREMREIREMREMRERMSSSQEMREMIKCQEMIRREKPR